MTLDVYLALFTYGGVDAATVRCLLHEFAVAKGVRFTFKDVGDDALISRSRSRAVQSFLDSPARVMVMIDHDIAWEPGDVAALARKAEETRGLVGGVYSCRAFRSGTTSRVLKQGTRWIPGGERVHPAEYVATGFLAIPRWAVKRIIEKFDTSDIHDTLRVRKVIGLSLDEPEYYDLFRPVSVPSTTAPGKYEYLSEDWAFSMRAAAAGVPVQLYERPKLDHYGRVPFGLANVFQPGK